MSSNSNYNIRESIISLGFVTNGSAKTLGCDVMIHAVVNKGREYCKRLTKVKRVCVTWVGKSFFYPCNALPLPLFTYSPLHFTIVCIVTSQLSVLAGLSDP